MTVRATDIRNVLAIGRADGWETALYEHAKLLVQRDQSLVEDERCADWIHLVDPAGLGSALVLGGDFGTVPVALSRFFARVCAAHAVPEAAEFARMRSGQGKIANVDVVLVGRRLALPFADATFDLVALTDFPFDSRARISFRRVCGEVRRVLRPGGVAYLVVPNRWSLQAMALRWPGDGGLEAQGWQGYWRTLRRAGFHEIHSYAPLPRYLGIPLFYVPLESRGGLRFFFENLFPLFEMVSPEAKRNAAVEYRVARAGVKLARLLRVEGLVRWFVPGFAFVARAVRS